MQAKFKKDYHVKLNRYSEKICSDEFVFKMNYVYNCEIKDNVIKISNIDNDVRVWFNMDYDEWKEWIEVM